MDQGGLGARRKRRGHDAACASQSIPSVAFWEASKAKIDDKLILLMSTLGSSI